MMQITFIKFNLEEMVAMDHIQPPVDVREPDQSSCDTHRAAASDPSRDYPAQVATPALIAGHHGAVPGWRMSRTAEAGA